MGKGRMPKWAEEVEQGCRHSQAWTGGSGAGVVGQCPAAGRNGLAFWLPLTQYLGVNCSGKGMALDEAVC